MIRFISLASLNERHRVATNIYKIYITSFGSAIVDEIDNAIINRMKSFIFGDQVTEYFLRE